MTPLATLCSNSLLGCPGITLDYGRLCPDCRKLVEDQKRVVRVTPETVVSICDVWLARRNGRYDHRLTVKVPIVTVGNGTAPPKQTDQGKPRRGSP